jgi:hypothetical protein
LRLIAGADKIMLLRARQFVVAYLLARQLFIKTRMATCFAGFYFARPSWRKNNHPRFAAHGFPASLPCWRTKNHTACFRLPPCQRIDSPFFAEHSSTKGTTKMKNLTVVIRAELEVPEDWTLVDHASGMQVLKIGNQLVDFDITPLSTMSDAPDAEWSDQDEDLMNTVLDAVVGIDIELALANSQ